MAAQHLYTLPVALNSEELAFRARLLSILAGSGNPEPMRRDADNVFEAKKYGGHFITNDARVLARATQIYELCGLSIVKPTVFLALVKRRLGV